MRLILVALPFLIFTSWAYYQRIGAFGCFDDCFNIAAGYFIGKGKSLYSEIFFNHQPLMAYLSYSIQAIKPDSLYQLILYHRIFIMLFSFLMNMLLVTRFGWVGLGFTLFYETTKYYMFGDRFLAENLVVYPLVYLLGLAFCKLNKRTIFGWEIIFASILTWFVIFMREPFVPVVLILYTSLLWTKSFSKKHLFSLILFSFLTLITIGLLPMKDYVFNVIEINAAVEVSAIEVYNNLPRIFGYPLYLLLEGQWNFLKPILVASSTVFIITVAVYTIRYRRLKQVLFIIFILGLANIRVVEPSTMFYEAFHIIPWYGLFIASTLLILRDLDKKIRIVGISTLIIILIYSTSPGSFLYEKIDSEHEFTTNYGHYFVQGEVIKVLSSSSDTLFVDGFDELIHWTADRPSPYKHSLYTSVMPRFPLYVNERNNMFNNNPPDFYYGNCPGDPNPQRHLPEESLKNYAQLTFAGRPTCLFVRKTQLKEMKYTQLEELQKRKFNFL